MSITNKISFYNKFCFKALLKFPKSKRMILNFWHGTMTVKFLSLSTPCIFLLATCKITSEESKCRRYEESRRKMEIQYIQEWKQIFYLLLKCSSHLHSYTFFLISSQKKTTDPNFTLSEPWSSIYTHKTHATSPGNQREKLFFLLKREVKMVLRAN